MVNYIATSLDNASETIAPRRMGRRRPPSEVCKIIVRGSLHQEGLVVRHGSHSAYLPHREARAVTDSRIWFAHFPERSPYQYITKFVRGWSKVLATGKIELDRRTSYHYKGPFEAMRDRPQDLLRSARFMSFKDESADLAYDPASYFGGDLKYTKSLDEPVRAVRNLMGLLNDMAAQHGRLLDQFPELRGVVQGWENERVKLL